MRDPSIDPVEAVEAGYDRMADDYLRAKDARDPALLASLEELDRAIPHGGAALDLGCGAGVPVTRWLAGRFAVTGIDVSDRQLELARARVPTATLIKASMTDVDFSPRVLRRDRRLPLDHPRAASAAQNACACGYGRGSSPEAPFLRRGP